ncbi:hypothetical protein CMUS01_04243 [Colletotrichum musicola]|uniref:Uncharacterized protein n=1 Tax=Colletotrichum musicola TaxID=2175873 RepID=A0A8H6KYC5_9PEZI|nr:hypothetical protein CMUS01_04243 [Colletotrichum musicola]
MPLLKDSLSRTIRGHRCYGHTQDQGREFCAHELTALKGGRQTWTPGTLPGARGRSGEEAGSVISKESTQPSRDRIKWRNGLRLDGFVSWV